MRFKEIIYKPIGMVYTPFKSALGTPIQPKAAKGVKGRIVIKHKYQQGVKDLSGFSYIILIYHFHLSQNYSLLVKPFMDDRSRGLFSTRAPRRPNSIGLSVVKLVNISGNVLEIEDVDLVDSTPLLDIKPYVPAFDVRKVEKIGWLKSKIQKLNKMKDDGRFVR